MNFIRCRKKRDKDFFIILLLLCFTVSFYIRWNRIHIFFRNILFLFYFLYMRHIHDTVDPSVLLCYLFLYISFCDACMNIHSNVPFFRFKARIKKS